MPDALAPARPDTRPPRVLLALLVGFIGAMAYLIATSLVPRDVPTFPPPTAAADVTAASGEPSARNRDAYDAAALAASGEHDPGMRIDTVTFDARDAERWQYFSLSRGATLALPDTAGWELAVRRYHVVVPGAAADLGAVELASVQTAPDTAFRVPDGRDDAGHPALRRWYSYGMLTHLLESKQHVYVVRTLDGSLAALQVLSYYCPGPTPGCLTIRYRHPLSNGWSARHSQ